ncbi:esterase B1-like [Anopheles nili]|uniref:esterase B1-like n=1 Tax=Anopheles nili TaxID=185578 RepID=UPI00237A1274|nr:esterase B1-like [Anopheles nili]
MVWIHGGGFCTGTGSSVLYEPPYLVQQGAVIVSINYRLGALGFLSLPTAGIPGNMGLKDQRMSFRWVRENIARFGGDPNNVTIFGESAGGASVQLHYLSEDSRPYFQKAIAQSGTAFNEWVWQREPVERTRKLAQLLGCKGDSDEDVLATLMNAPAEKMAALQNQVLSEREQTLLLRFPFTPVIEKAGSEDAIITEHPSQATEKKFREEIPIVLGSTNEEGLLLWPMIPEKLPFYSSDPSRFIPGTLTIQGDENARYASDEIARFFFQNQPVSLDTIGSIATVLGDNLNMLAGYVAAELHARYQSAPMYMYVFSFVGELNKYRQEMQVPPEHPGAAHGDDLYYLFSSTAYKTEVADDESTAGKFRAYLCNLWVNFARTGNPNPQGTADWTPIERSTQDADQYFPSVMNLEHVDSNKMTTELFYERFQFWKNLYHKFNGSHLLPQIE